MEHYVPANEVYQNHNLEIYSKICGYSTKHTLVTLDCKYVIEM